ncbi:MAG: hypothetical protein ABL961_13145, partial [Vicinamibacterales bacterium]
MRVSLSRFTAPLVIGVAIVLLHSSASLRVGGRDRDRGRRTTTRAGCQRLDGFEFTSQGQAADTTSCEAEAGD